MRRRHPCDTEYRRNGPLAHLILEAVRYALENSGHPDSKRQPKARRHDLDIRRARQLKAQLQLTIHSTSAQPIISPVRVRGSRRPTAVSCSWTHSPRITTQTTATLPISSTRPMSGFYAHPLTVSCY